MWVAPSGCTALLGVHLQWAEQSTYLHEIESEIESERERECDCMQRVAV